MEIMDKSKYHPPKIIKDGGVTVKVYELIRTE